TAKLANLRRRPRAVLVFRHGWEWVAVHGPAELAGPDDPLDGMAAAEIPQLLRDIYAAAGGPHPDPAEHHRGMARERRTPGLIRPERLVSNPTGTDHEEPE